MLLQKGDLGTHVNFIDSHLLPDFKAAFLLIKPKIEEKHIRCRNKRPQEVDLLLASALLWVRKEAATAVGSDGGGEAPATCRRRYRSFDGDGEREKESSIAMEKGRRKRPLFFAKP
ncbi:hypothetical protein LXL04_037071 [Taraxacum kok-saghyz]